MVRTTGTSRQSDKHSSQSASTGYEAMLGRLIIEMLRAGQPVSRASLCARIAFLISDSSQPSQTVAYEELLRLLLTADR